MSVALDYKLVKIRERFFRTRCNNRTRHDQAAQHLDHLQID